MKCNYFSQFCRREKVKQIMNMEIEEIYCPKCTACGIEGCCSPIMCNQEEGGLYCKEYLNLLKNRYKEYERILELIYQKDEKLFDELMEDKIIDELYQIYIYSDK